MYSDLFRDDRLPADPAKRWQMLEDVKEAHRWATSALESAVNERARYALIEERKRLAGIAAKLRQPRTVNA